MTADQKTPMIDLTGAEQNAFKIITRATNAMRECGWTERQIEAFRAKARHEEVAAMPTKRVPQELLDHVLATVTETCLIFNHVNGPRKAI